VDTPAAIVASAVVDDYHAEITHFLADPAVAEGWDWFMYHAHGFEAMPVVLIKMLPELDPGIWGPPEEKFARFGHFVLPGDEDRVLPSSMGITQFPSSSDPHGIMVTTESCGTCHTGRVRLPAAGAQSSKILFLYGGVNTQFDIRRWRTCLENTVVKYMADAAGLKQTALRLRTLVAAKPVGFFNPDPEEDRRQRQYILAPGGAEKILDAFVTWTAGFTSGKKRQLATSYKNSDGRSPNIDVGHPGQVDASGDLLAQRLPLSIGMPAGASLTDIPSVWKQSEYATGQWDGSVTNQFIRNLAAEVAVVPGNTVDRRVAYYALQFVTALPPPKYPFASAAPDHEAALVAKGAKLFAANCADCHKALSTQTFGNLGTDMNRAKVMTKTGAVVMAKIFYDACHAKLPDGTVGPDCGNFLSSLGGSDGSAGPGYAAKPLTGIWARAPYLHNGSVPTLRQLLLPATRPTRFVVGSLDYDRVNVGFKWDINQIATYRQVDPQVDIFDTTQDGLSNKGHDQSSITANGKQYRLNWTPREGDDPEAVDALLAYLKTI